MLVGRKRGRARETMLAEEPPEGGHGGLSLVGLLLTISPLVSGRRRTSRPEASKAFRFVGSVSVMREGTARRALASQRRDRRRERESVRLARSTPL